MARDNDGAGAGNWPEEGFPAEVADAILVEMQGRVEDSGLSVGWMVWGVEWEERPVAMGESDGVMVYGCEIRSSPLLGGTGPCDPAGALESWRLPARYTALVLGIAARNAFGRRVLSLAYLDRAGAGVVRRFTYPSDRAPAYPEPADPSWVVLVEALVPCLGPGGQGAGPSEGS